MSLLSSVTKSAPQLPSRVVLYAPEKAGKTSFGCHAPDPIFLMTAGETGLLSLIEAGQVPPTNHFPDDFKTWADLTAAVRSLLTEKHAFKTLVLDTGNGAEQMLLADTCQSSFDGNYSEFNAYGRGLAIALPRWADFLKTLDDLRVRRRMAVLFLHHSRVKAFQNPAGKDWDQWKPEAVDKLWSLTHKWADVIAFYGSRATVDRDGKALGQEQRFLRCAPSAAIVAGNRYGIPDEITAPPGADKLWAAFAKALVAAKAKGRPAAEKPAEQQSAPKSAPAAEPSLTDLRKRCGRFTSDAEAFEEFVLYLQAEGGGTDCLADFGANDEAELPPLDDMPGAARAEMRDWLKRVAAMEHAKAGA